MVNIDGVLFFIFLEITYQYRIVVFSQGYLCYVHKRRFLPKPLYSVGTCTLAKYKSK